jgi:hypothetical protein
MTHNTKVSVATIITVLVLVLAGSMIFAASRRHADNPAKSGDSERTVLSSVIKSGDSSKCSSVNTDTGGVNGQTVCQNNIAWHKAIANLDMRACNSLDNDLMTIEDCQNAVITASASSGKDVSICDQLSGASKDACVSSYWYSAAQSKSDPSLCAKVTPSSTQAIATCQDSILIASVVRTPNTTLACASFTGSALGDCQDYVKTNCKAILFPPLQQACLLNEQKNAKSSK